MARWVKAPKGQITEHFSWDEAKCRCCGRVPDVDIVIETAEWLEKVRSILGHPIKVLSWCRCPKHNEAVGGAKKSLHLLGIAVDFTCKLLSPEQVRRKLDPDHHGGGLIGGMGEYRGFTHVDRGPFRSWTG